MERSDDARLAAFLASNAAHRAKLNEARARDVAKQQAFRAEFGEAIERWREDQEQALEAEAARNAGGGSHEAADTKVEVKSDEVH